MSIKKGDKIKVDYTGTLEDGTVFDSSKKAGKPIEFEVGAGQLIKGFDEAVIGMKKGDVKDITLQPEEAYGVVIPQAIQKVPKTQLPVGQEPAAGMILMVGLPTGQQMPATITEVEEETVTIDLNHPLAGKVLKFNITIVDC